MDSIKELYKIGYGPSSSHTMGPQKAASIFLERNKNADKFSAELFGSLSLTGKGHLTDYIIKKTLGVDKTEIIFNNDFVYDYHPNALKFKAYVDNKLVDEWLVFSVGGGDLMELNEKRNISKSSVYPHNNMTDILKYCKDEKISLVEYVKRFDNVRDYLKEVLSTMFSTIESGLNKRGVLPGSLKLKRKANDFYLHYLQNKNFSNFLYAASLATAEENASANLVVTAPTCGSSGVLPAVLYTSKYYNNINDDKLLDALMLAGLIGNIIKYNGSISGAEVGCQGEIGSACSMAAGAYSVILGSTNEQIEYASEIALEHNLGLTCDPVDGLVQIPCIERNALASAKAIDAANYAALTDGNHHISFDNVIKVMKETGKDLNLKYRETSTGGLAKK